MKLIVVKKVNPQMEKYTLGKRIKPIGVILILLFFSFNSCSHKQDKQIIKLNIDENVETDYSSIFERVEYLQLKIPSDRVMGNIGKVFFTEGYIGVLDRRKESVWIFDNKGELVNEISIIIGRGPGEVLTLSDVDFGREKQIHVLGAYRINTFDFNGQLKKEIQLPFLSRSFEYSEKGDFFLTFMNNEIATPKGDQKKGLYNLFSVSRDGKIIDRFLPFQQSETGLSRLLISNFYSYDNTIHHYSFLNNNIYQVTGKNSVEKKYTIDYGENQIPDELFEKRDNYQTGLDFLRKEIYTKNFLVLSTVMETSKHLIIGVNYSSKRGYLIYDKKEGISRFSSSDNFINDFNLGLDIYFHISRNDHIYGVKSVSELREFIEKNENASNEELTNLISKNNDGPILIKAKLN